MPARTACDATTQLHRFPLTDVSHKKLHTWACGHWHHRVHVGRAVHGCMHRGREDHWRVPRLWPLIILHGDKAHLVFVCDVNTTWLVARVDYTLHRAYVSHTVELACTRKCHSTVIYACKDHSSYPNIGAHHLIRRHIEILLIVSVDVLIGPWLPIPLVLRLSCAANKPQRL